MLWTTKESVRLFRRDQYIYGQRTFHVIEGMSHVGWMHSRIWLDDADADSRERKKRESEDYNARPKQEKGASRFIH